MHGKMLKSLYKIFMLESLITTNYTVSYNLESMILSAFEVASNSGLLLVKINLFIAYLGVYECDSRFIFNHQDSLGLIQTIIMFLRNPG